MEFRIIETGEVLEIRIIDDDTGCDCFWDMEQNFPHDYPERDDDGNIICSQEDYDDLKDYWVDEVETYLDGTNPDWCEVDDDGNVIEGSPLTMYVD